MFHVSAFLFYVGFVFGMFFFVLVLFCFASCFAFTDYANTVFPAILVFYSCWLQGSFFVLFHVLVIVCFSCVVCFHIRQLIVLFCVCVLFFFF